MIAYVEIKDKYTLDTVALVEPQECWFELAYQACGEFEIFCRASKANLAALQKGRYVKLPNKRFIWVITAVRYTFTAGGARMILASGYEAKWLLSKRCILTPRELSGTISGAIYTLVDLNLGSGASAERVIEKFAVTYNDWGIDIALTQAPRGNLLDFATELLTAYDCGHQVVFDGGTLFYDIFVGNDMTSTVRFSQSLDNLLASEFVSSDAGIATHALVVSEVNDLEYLHTVDTGETGIDRAEIIVESRLSTSYEDENGEKREINPYSFAFVDLQNAEGENALAEHRTAEEINGEIDLANSLYVFDVDFYIGDLVRVQDEHFNFSQNVRITKYTIKQDANGYGEEAEYGGVSNE